jgi:phosphate acetyltransferase
MLRQKAANSPRKLILADGEDPRVIEAAAKAVADHIAYPVLVGNEKIIRPIWQRFSTSKADILDPQAFSETQKDTYRQALGQLAKYKALPPPELEARLSDPLVLGCLALRMNEVEGFIGGAARTTADTLRAAFSIVGLCHGISTLFGFFLIENRTTGALVLLADCAVIPEPSAKQLAQIGIQGAAAYSFLTGDDARVAFLSFSTHGSAEHASVETMRQALALAREKAPALVMDGEWQADAALDTFTAGIKGVDSSPMAGRANILVVPDLNCGNIAYKLVQRLGGCRAVGPVLWGLQQPANDLSRGCSVEDVLDMMALTGIQAQAASTAMTAMPPMKAQVH